jgi:Spy/CpxP family protein refolding chaperone
MQKMKKIISVTLVLGMALFSFVEVAGQHPDRRHNFADKQEASRGRSGAQGWEEKNHKLQLTDEQRVKVRELKQSQMQQTLVHKNTLREKMTQVKTLTSGDDVNLQKVDKLLAEIQAVKTQMAKDRINAKIMFRNLLSEEQQAMMPASRHPQQLKKRHKQGVKNRMLHGKVETGRPGKYAVKGKSTRQHPKSMHLKLTEEQKEEMKSLRLERLKSMTQFKNQQDELKASLATAMSVKDVEVKSVHKLIDQLGKIELEKAKSDVRHQQNIRNILDEEQKVYFDWQRAQGKSHPAHRKG